MIPIDRKFIAQRDKKGTFYYMNLSNFILLASVSLSEKGRIKCQFSVVSVIKYNILSVASGT